MFNDEDRLKFKLFCQQVTLHPKPLFMQSYRKQEGFIWCPDWEVIELCKFFFNGEGAYMGDPPPNRLKGNPLWSKEHIAAQARDLMGQFTTADGIIDALKSRRATAASGLS